MSDISIKFENVSKQYRLGKIGTGTISHDLNRWWAKIRGKEDPYLKIGQVNDRSLKATSKYVWALKGFDYEVKQGEVLGIIGKNGAGKSTLLKILSRVTSPTTGMITARGRIASLLEVGTGFHPEMTGRENIYMNGSIMGMTKKEITSKFDEIVDFAGTEKYIDTPVKRYSSGMTVRLGFAIAAHLEPEILVVDEVLAVGDAEFQKKALGKMQEVSSDKGRTVLFVSHNMPAVKSLCTKGILLKNGEIDFVGSAEETVDKYLIPEHIEIMGGHIPRDFPERLNLGYAFFRTIRIKNELGIVRNSFYFREKLIIETELEVFKDIKDALISMQIATPLGIIILFKDTALEFPNGQFLNTGLHKFSMPVHLHLLPGNYCLFLSVSHSDGTTIDWLQRIYDFTIEKVAVKKNEEYRWTKSWGYVLNTNKIEHE